MLFSLVGIRTQSTTRSRLGPGTDSPVPELIPCAKPSTDIDSRPAQPSLRVARDTLEGSQTGLGSSNGIIRKCPTLDRPARGHLQNRQFENSRIEIRGILAAGNRPVRSRLITSYLVVTQGHHWIHARRLVRWNQAGQCSDRNHQQAGGRDRCRIDRADPK